MLSERIAEVWASRDILTTNQIAVAVATPDTDRKILSGSEGG